MLKINLTNLLKRLKKPAQRHWPALGMVLGALVAPKVIDLAHYQDLQVILYDQGLQFAQSHDKKNLEVAPQLFEASKQIYEQRQLEGFWQRFFLPTPLSELVAMSDFHQGNLLYMQKKTKDSLAFYADSLRLNAGQRILDHGGIFGPGADDAMHQYGKDSCVDAKDELAQSEYVQGQACELARLQKEADDTRNNIVSALNQPPPKKKPQEKQPQESKTQPPQTGQGKKQANKEEHVPPPPPKPGIPKGDDPGAGAGHNIDDGI